MHQDHRHLPSLERPFLDGQRRKRKQVSVPTHRREVLQQPIGDRQTRWPAAVIDPNEQHPRLAVPRQVVGKRANSESGATFTGLSAAVRGPL